MMSVREIENTTGTIANDPMRYFDVHITPKAQQQLTAIKTSINKATIVLVIDNDIVFIIDPDHTIEHILRIAVFTDTEALAMVREKIVDHVAQAKNQ